MTDEGYVEISGVPGSKYPLVRMEKEDVESVEAHSKVLAETLFTGKMILCFPAPDAFWRYVQVSQLFVFKDGYEAIMGIGLYMHEGEMKKLAVYDKDRLIESLSYTSRGSKGEEVGDDYAENLLASLRRQGSPETGDSIGLRFK